MWPRTSAGTIYGTPERSWHVQAGTPLQDLQELGGWESVEVIRRYVHLAPDHLAEYAEYVAGQGTKLAHTELKAVRSLAKLLIGWCWRQESNP
jgi:hypothetical protein